MDPKKESEALEEKLSLMMMGDSSEAYSQRAMTLAYEPLNVGELKNPDASAVITGDCGDRFMISLMIADGKITEARFLTDGCGATLACGSAVTELVKGKTLFQSKKIFPQTVIKYLDGLPASHGHCAVLAVQTLWKALDSYTAKR